MMGNRRQMGCQISAGHRCVLGHKQNGFCHRIRGCQDFVCRVSSGQTAAGLHDAENSLLSFKQMLRHGLCGDVSTHHAFHGVEGGQINTGVNA